MADAYGHGFAFGLSIPVLSRPRLPSTPFCIPVTSEKTVLPAAGGRSRRRT